MKRNSADKKITLGMLEKWWFPYRKAKFLHGRPVIFPGCNGAFYLPETTRRIFELANRHQCGWMIDCCGKPLQGTSLYPKVKQRILKQLKHNNTTALLVFCPNCYELFEKEMDIPVRPIYDWLKEQGVLANETAPEGKVFLPCPDRKNKVILESYIRWTKYDLKSAEGVPCCGLDSNQAQNASQNIGKLKNFKERLLPYCASCLSQFHRHKIATGKHLLSWALKIEEKTSSPLKGRLWSLLYKK